MPSGSYKRTKIHIQHITGRGNSFFGKRHTLKTIKINAAFHARPIGSIRFLQTKGYKEIKVTSLKWKRLSRYLTEQYIGYKLRKKWMVHHIDGNPKHDIISNFYIFKNMGLHFDFEILVKHGIIKRSILMSNLKEFKQKG